MQCLPSSGSLKRFYLARRQEFWERPKVQQRKWIRFCESGMLGNRAFSNLKPTGRGVWEMKTVDLRIFGWLWRPKIFIATFASLADDYKSQDGQPPKESYDEARDRVVWIRARLDLDPPTFVTGEYNALV